MLVMEEDKTASGLDQHRRFGLALSVLLGLAWAHCACAAPKHFNLPAGDAGKMLNQFSQQAEMQLLFDFTKLAGKQTHAVVGDYEPLDALKKLIDGLPVKYTLVNDRTLALTVTPDRAAPRPRRWWQRLAAKPAAAPPVNALEQVLVAGSNSLDQAPPVGAALIRLDRVDIERSGIATAPEFLQTLPQVFGGGPSQDTRFNGREAPTNASKGTGVNLRGLDAGATLVLIDGQRTAPSGTAGLFADIAYIPLSAVDHIDVLPDGASAQYGADAIGGVVNFVLRSFSGAETHVRDGDFTTNPLGGRVFSQLFGGRIGSNIATVGFEFYDRGALPATDRRQATSNLAPLGGDNFDLPYGYPGTIIVGKQSWAIPKGGLNNSAALIPETQNLYDQWSGVDVLLDEKRWSAFGTLRSELGDDVQLNADSLFSRREISGSTNPDPLTMTVGPANPFYFNPSGGTGPVSVITGSQTYFGTPRSDDRVDYGNMGLGVTWKLSDAWSLTAHGGYTFENDHTEALGLFDNTALATALADPDSATALDPFADSGGNNPATLAAISRTGFFESRSALSMASVRAAGSLFRAPGGNAYLDLGAEYQHQDFATTSWTAATISHPVLAPPSIPAREELSRNVRAEFVELRVPLVGPENSRTLLRALEVSFGGRAEDYSDVGRAAVPKTAFAWSPAQDVTVRGTWTKSFRPPALADLATTNSRSVLVTLPDASSPSGGTTVLAATGTNPNLADERARTWTLGAQLTPRSLPGLSLSLTYFDTDYEHRIESIALTPNVLNAPEFAWLVNTNFSSAQREAICNETLFAGAAADCVGAPISAILDNRLRNIEDLQTNGLDLIGKYGFDTVLGRFDVSLNATYLLAYAEQKAPDSALVQLLNTQYYPINLRFRSSLGWERRGFGVSLFTNFDNGYRDVQSTPNRGVHSFTTLDLQLRYRIDGSRPGFLANTEVALTAENLFNSSPPFLNNPQGIGYDQENADLTGRILSVDVRKRW
jgi:iron complex outermembrane recepter protein